MEGGPRETPAQARVSCWELSGAQRPLKRPCYGCGTLRTNVCILHILPRWRLEPVPVLWSPQHLGQVSVLRPCPSEGQLARKRRNRFQNHLGYKWLLASLHKPLPSAEAVPHLVHMGVTQTQINTSILGSQLFLEELRCKSAGLQLVSKLALRV